VQPQYQDSQCGAQTTPGTTGGLYGGIVRDVWLTLGGPIQVTRQQIRSQVSPAGTEVMDRIFLESN